MKLLTASFLQGKSSSQVVIRKIKKAGEGHTSSRDKYNTWKCFNGKQVGYISKDCPSKIKPCMKAVASAIVEDVQVKIKEKGSENTAMASSVCVVHACEHEWVNPDNIKLACGKHLPIVGGTCDQQEASQYFIGTVEAMYMTNPVCLLVLGNIHGAWPLNDPDSD